MPTTHLWARFKEWVQRERRVLMTSSTVASCVIILRLAGILQSWELDAQDQIFCWRPQEPDSKRVVIVEINEADLQKVKQWPIPDGVMAELLQKINAYQPRTIGLDIYRDIPVEPGHREFVKVASSMPKLIGIERLKDAQSMGVEPPPMLERQQQVGFNNVIVDFDGRVRRSLLYWHVDGKAHTSFALGLALMYLKDQDITPQAASVNPKYLQLGKVVFQPFGANDGAYVNADARGYQILVNFKKPYSFTTVSMADVLSGRVKPELLRDRLVLIGSTASSLQDFFYTPYSSGFLDVAQPISGIELHANFVSQILSATLDGRPLIKVWPKPLDILWIWGWSWVGATLSWRFRSPLRLIFSLLLAGVSLTGSAYLAFICGYWIPLVPPLLALAGSNVTIIGYLAHLEEELKRSKDFLQKVINTIPDPIFVKDKDHRCIILNQAYCRFIGYPLDVLVGKSEYDIFPRHEADIFWQRNELVLRMGKESEHEEEFTNAKGITRLIETKRSLHKDAAGNLFLVGIIRDITERKRSEEDLKRKTLELARDNAELKLSEDRLRHLAYHDPLTGLPNRKMFYEHLNQSLDRAVTNHQMVALLFLDLDGFKQVNDNLGHDMGDLLLKAVAKRLIGCLRGSDTVSRLGGDEFTVILPGIPKIEDATIVAEKIRDTLSQIFVLEGYSISVTVSIGISIYPFDGETVDALIKNADMAMYRAKESGRNQVFTYSS